MNDASSGETVESARALLDGIGLDEYYGPAMRTDADMEQMLLALINGSARQRQSLVYSLTEQRRRALARYAHRAPMVAMQTSEAAHLDAGLVAHSLLRQRVSDWRDDLVFFAPYHHVARALGLDPATLFNRAAAVAAPDLAEVMRTFGRRRDVSLGAFGWRQIDAPGGPTFESLNWGGAPTGAVVGDESWDRVNRAQVEELMRWIKSPSEQRGEGSES